ncbi:hypothetical protein [Deinococcus fonticola]|uniref:hypothetical protein n=1 Tax=Deinococcus fonticola TaxID=2528713 RepID=UPI001074B063|nr:hypothetical protein [Deinococcus fonticola]
MTFSDDQARKLTQALQQADLEALLPLIREQLPVPPNQAYTLLRLIFEQAAREHVNLLYPPDDFHPWLLRAASINHNGREAKPNTMRLRVSLLSKIYSYLVDQELLLKHPLQHLKRPPNERKTTPLLPRADLERLHLHTRADPALHAALILIDEHAFRVRELLQLQWEDFDPATGAALRPHALTRLSDTALHALHPLQAQAGGTFARGRVFPYKYERDLRSALHLACRQANVPYTPPGELRRVALRDHPFTAQQAGFAALDGDRSLAKATELARGVAERLGGDRGHTEPENPPQTP